MTAALIGISFGRTKIGKKSLEGTLACFFTCYLIGMIIFWHMKFWEYICLVGAITAALVELLNPSFLDDNFTVPFTSATALHFAIARAASLVAVNQ